MTHPFLLMTHLWLPTTPPEKAQPPDVVFQALPDLASDHSQSPPCTRLHQWRKRISFSWRWFLPSSLGPPRGNDSFISSESVISYSGGGVIITYCKLKLLLIKASLKISKKKCNVTSQRSSPAGPRALPKGSWPFPPPNYKCQNCMAPSLNYCHLEREERWRPHT